jgi:hypothetical protein
MNVCEECGGLWMNHIKDLSQIPSLNTKPFHPVLKTINKKEIKNETKKETKK